MNGKQFKSMTDQEIIDYFDSPETYDGVPTENIQRIKSIILGPKFPTAVKYHIGDINA